VAVLKTIGVLLLFALSFGVFIGMPLWGLFYSGLTGNAWPFGACIGLAAAIGLLWARIARKLEAKQPDLGPPFF
jgi:hypothetical protein